ncbi:cytochrome C oxidase subunit IV family protein [Myxococcus stipitatus]|uniref:cytochrome C oxidase subunit IV family protein n=1 Tax=Myxococcus stipitatus TaxID=83455 RepID=UPI001F2507FB|nr:cytochrome C oxidase subunit IV family protein [Myxococcus stipitatus]MCE9670216.1 cytochrome C oxidase subunit IV family protein [Myxococcus stipitatus]
MAGSLKMLGVGLGLLVLTTLSFTLSRLHTGTLGLVVALVIAATKVGLIAFFFMHLSERHGGPRLVFATAFTFVVILVGLVLVEAGDRAAPTMPPGPFQPLLLPGRATVPKRAPPREAPSGWLP